MRKTPPKFIPRVLTAVLFALPHLLFAQQNLWLTTYYSTWMMRSSPSGEPPWTINWSQITHVVQFFGFQNIDTTTFPYWAPVTNSAWATSHAVDSVEARFGARSNPGAGPSSWTFWLDSLAAIAHRNGAKVVEDIHQVGDLTGWNFVSRDSARADTFAAAVVGWCQRRGLDGVELDLEQFGAVKIESIPNTNRLIRLLRKYLNRMSSRGTIIIAAPAGDSNVYYASQDSIVDHYDLQFYIFADAWDPTLNHNATWHLSPLHRGSGLPSGSNYGSISEGRMYDNRWSVASWANAGHDTKKIGVGLNTYGNIYSGVDSLREPSPYANYTSNKECLAAANNGGTVVWDSTCKENFIRGTATTGITGGPWHTQVVAPGSKFFITYKSARALQEDVAWVKSQGLGGIMLYDMCQDYDPSQPPGQMNPLHLAVAAAISGTTLTPPTGSLTVAPDTLPAGGGPVTLSWSSQNASSASIAPGIGSVATSGSRVVQVSATTRFTLTLTNAIGSVSYADSVNVRPAPVLTAPALRLPTNGSTGLSIPVTITWDSVAGSTSYYVQVATDTGMASVVYLDTARTTRSCQLSTLANGTKYYWRVRAKNQGNSGPFSAVWSFATIVASPAAPILAAPPNNAVGLATPITLAWRHTAGAQLYVVQVASDTLFASILLTDSTLTDTTRVVSTGLSPATKYFWRVRGKNQGGTGPVSLVWSFTTVVAPPIAPRLVAPANNSAGLLTPISLIWNRASGTSSYALQVASDTGFANILISDTTLTDTSDAVAAGLDPATKYFWRVRAKNPGGASPFSTPWSFTTSLNQPEVPTLSAPANNSTGLVTPIVLTWYRADDAARYALQVASDSLFVSPLINDSTIIDTARVISSGLNAGTEYFWRVRGINASFTSPFSQAWTFMTLVAPPSAPLLAAPVDNATNQSSPLLLQWHAAPRAVAYRVQVAGDSAFRTLILDDSTVVDTSRSVVEGLDPSTLYFWRVQARNGGGTGSYSGMWRFTTNARVLSAPILSSPMNSAAKQPVSMTFTWIPLTDAQSYRLQVSTDSLFRSIVLDDSTISTNSRQVALTNRTVYYWRARAKNASTTSVFSGTWNFKTVMAKPKAPGGMSPAPGATNQPTTLVITWSRPADADSFHLQVASDSAFQAIAFDTVTTDTAARVRNLRPATTYFGHVKALNVDTCGDYCSYFSFTTTAAGQGSPGTIPRDYILYQNFPNPFNPSTIIAYSIPEPARVKITVYNVLGQELETLVNDFKAPGNYTVRFNGDRYPSGVYFYILSTGSNTQYQKMILLK